jgi:hypothetical protein
VAVPPAAGQVKEITLEAGASSVRPPVGLEGDAAQFMVGGVRAMAYSVDGTGVMASLQAGRSLTEGSGGDYLSGTLDGAYWKEFATGWSGGFEARGFAFDVVEPFPYRAVGLEGGPGIRFANRRVSANLKGVFGVGSSRTELVSYEGGAGAVLEEDLWRAGVTAELLVGSPGAMVGVAGGVHDSPGGTYQSVGGRLLLRGGGAVMEFMLDSWDTPLGRETTGGMALIIPLGGWSVRGFLGRTEPDPLTLAEPGSGAGGVMVGRRILGAEALPLSGNALHEVLRQDGGVARIRLRVKPDRNAQEVGVMGDFTLWEPVSMEQEGEEWVAVLEVPEGVHHFGFLVDGEWFVPDNAPDAVADEWGRVNATLVIER